MTDEEEQLEDELEADVGQVERGLPPALMLFGGILFAAAFLPLTPGGNSFAALVLAAFGRSPLEGLMLTLGFGAPFWFGLLVALGAWPGGPLASSSLRQMLVSNASLLHGQLAVVAWVLWRDGIGALPFALLGFAGVSGLFFVVQHASASAAEGSVDDRGRRHEGLATTWLIRWNATMIVGVCGWLRLQLLVGIGFGWAVEVALASSMAIAVLTMKRPSVPD